MGNINEELQMIKKKWETVEMRSTSEMKNLLEELKRKNNKNQHRSIEIMQSKNRREKEQRKMNRVPKKCGTPSNE